MIPYERTPKLSAGMSDRSRGDPPRIINGKLLKNLHAVYLSFISLQGGDKGKVEGGRACPTRNELVSGLRPAPGWSLRKALCLLFAHFKLHRRARAVHWPRFHFTTEPGPVISDSFSHVTKTGVFEWLVDGLESWPSVYSRLF